MGISSFGCRQSSGLQLPQKRGGRLPHFNSILRPFVRWCEENHLNLRPNWVKSEDMLADGLSRWAYDKGDYTLSKTLFASLLHIFSQVGFQPQVDMFASPGNAQLPQFVSRWPHHQALAVNALETPLGSQFSQVYANPPWTVIHRWLQRLVEKPLVVCLMVVPYWVGTVWWPLLTRLHIKGTPTILINPRWGMFQNCLGEEMPPTKWPLICLMLSGKHFRENKFRLKTSKYI